MDTEIFILCIFHRLQNIILYFFKDFLNVNTILSLMASLYKNKQARYVPQATV